MKEYFDFNGTAKRQEYWGVIIAVFVVIIVSTIIVETGALGALIGLIALLASLWVLLATTVRRLRDADLNVFWVLVTLIPYVGTVATIVIGCVASVEKAEKNNDGGIL